MMKKFSTVILLILLLTVSLFAVVSCGDETTDGGELTLEIKDMPQLTYIVGNALDLSNGVLTVTENGESREVAMNDAGVTVSGFDKDKVGEQKVTLTYGGKTVEITVTVVERMQVIEHVTDYLVGDELDTSKGRLKIIRDDGSSYTVILNHEKVKLEGFDSAKAGSCDVKASYEADGETYTCTFAVKVYEVESVKLQRPNKLAYDSHEGGLDLAGGYLTLTGNGGALTKDIPLTDDSVEVKGFDLSVVNETKPQDDQRITVVYDEKEYYYDIRLTYTDISHFKAKSPAFANLDWSGDEWPEISEELGSVAIELMEIYLDMSPAERQYLTWKECVDVARAAFSHGMSMLDDDFVALDDAFTIEGGGLVLTCRTPEALTSAIEILEDEDGDLYTVSPLIASVIEIFAEEELLPEMYFADFGVLDVEIYEGLIAVFEYMLELHEMFETLPVDWESQGINNFANELDAIYDFIFASDYADGTWGEIYHYVSAWRAEDNVFEALYTYYYEADNREAMSKLSTVRLPVSLEVLASYIALALEQMDAIASFQAMDTSNFFFNYYMAIRTAEDILANESEMTRALYEILPINTLMGLDPSVSFYFNDMLDYLRTMEGGYYHYSGALLDLPVYHELMDHYMDILIRILEEDGYRDSAEYNADIEEMFAMYVALTPTRQLNFLGTLNAYYAMSIPPVAFDDSGESAYLTCLFVDLLNQYYRGLFEDENAVKAYNELVIAMEMYAQRFSTENWLEDFRARMESVTAARNAIANDEERDAFDRKLGFAYNKYLEICAMYDQEPEVLYGDLEDEFAALDEAIMATNLSYMAMNQAGIPMYTLFFSAVERAMALEEYILERASDELLEAYRYQPLCEMASEAEDGSVESMFFTYEYVMTTYRGLYVNMLLTTLDIGIYDYYVGSELQSFMEMTYDAIWVYLLSDPESELVGFDRETMLAIMTKFSNLNADDKTLFVLMEPAAGGGDSSLMSGYYVAVEAFLAEAFTENASNVALRVLLLEQKCLTLEVLGDEEARADVQTALDELQPLYAALEGEDKESFKDLEEWYSNCVAKANQLLEEEPAVPDETDTADPSSPDLFL